jgi:hypothetical protein
MTIKHRRLLAFAATVLIGGCSPYLYGDEIKGFNTALSTLKSTVADARDATVADVRDFQAIRLRRRVASQRNKISLSPACTAAIEAAGQSTTLNPTPDLACDLEVGPSGQAPIIPPIYIGSDSFEQAGKLLSELEAYAKALAAITDAGDSKALSDAATGVCTTAGAIAATAGGILGVALAPGCKLASLAVIGWLNNRRYEVLQTAVDEVDTRLMPRAQTFLAERLIQVASQRIISRASLIERDLDVANSSSGSDPIRRDVEERAIRRLMDNVPVIRSLLREDASEPARKMADAHHTLREALKDPSRQVADVGQAVSDFLAAVVKLRDALKQNAN